MQDNIRGGQGPSDLVLIGPLFVFFKWLYNKVRPRIASERRTAATPFQAPWKCELCGAVVAGQAAAHIHVDAKHPAEAYAVVQPVAATVGWKPAGESNAPSDASREDPVS